MNTISTFHPFLQVTVEPTSAVTAQIVAIGGGLSGDVVTNLYPGSQERLDTTRRRDFLARPLPLTAQVVVALSDFRRVMYARLAADGFDLDDERVMLLIDTVIYQAERADFGRRAGDSVRDTAEVTPWMAKMERQLAQTHERITEMRNALQAA